MIRQIRKITDGTILKGSLSLENEKFTLRIFDNMENIRRWRKPAVLSKDYINETRLDKTGVPVGQTAFYGINALLQMIPE